MGSPQQPLQPAPSRGIRRTDSAHERGHVAGRVKAHLAWWMREVADVRAHGTTGEAPMARFEREEQQALRPLNGRPPFRQLRELTRRVQNDACVDIDTNHYSVPWKLIGAEVTVQVGGGEIRIHHGGIEVACHDKRLGRRERAVDRAHLHGIVPCCPNPASNDAEAASPTTPPGIELLRSLAEYEQAVGGGW